jgi:hypothetical protein
MRDCDWSNSQTPVNFMNAAAEGLPLRMRFRRSHFRSRLSVCTWTRSCDTPPTCARCKYAMTTCLLSAGTSSRRLPARAAAGAEPHLANPREQHPPRPADLPPYQRLGKLGRPFRLMVIKSCTLLSIHSTATLSRPSCMPTQSRMFPCFLWRGSTALFRL